MSIIENLRIKDLERIPCVNIKPSEACDYTAVNYELLRKKEIEYRELLEALVDAIEALEDSGHFFTGQYSLLIEKADPQHRPWSEIKEL